MTKSATKASRAAGDLEKQLKSIMDQVEPGQVVLSKSRLAIYDGKPGYEITVDTRESKMTWTSPSISAVVADAVDDIQSPTEDPIRPAWRRLTRMQREVVVRTLEGLAAKHMASAAAAKIARKPEAFMEWELADAFHAAVEELHVVELDENDEVVRDEKLRADPPPGTGTVQ